MHCVAWPRPEDRVMPIFAVARRTAIAALEPARNIGVAKIPAARPLQQVAANGGDVANLRACRDRGRLRERAQAVLRAPIVRPSPLKAMPLGSTRFTFTSCSGAARSAFISVRRSVPPAMAREFAPRSGNTSSMRSGLLYANGLIRAAFRA
jgi:hypothetical protein